MEDKEKSNILIFSEGGKPEPEETYKTFREGREAPEETYVPRKEEDKEPPKPEKKEAPNSKK